MAELKSKMCENEKLERFPVLWRCFRDGEKCIARGDYTREEVVG